MEYGRVASTSYATSFPGFTRQREPWTWERDSTHNCDNCDDCNSFGIQTQATLVEGECSHRCAILVPTFLFSVAYLREVRRAIKESERAKNHHLPYARIGNGKPPWQRFEMKGKEELRWVLANTREGKNGTHIRGLVIQWTNKTFKEMYLQSAVRRKKHITTELNG